IFGSRAKRTVGLRPITPDALTDPFWGNAFTYGIHRTRSIAVRNDTRIGHPHSKRILALLHIAGIDAGSSNANSHLPGLRLQVLHFTNDQNIPRRALSL